VPWLPCLALQAFKRRVDDNNKTLALQLLTYSLDTLVTYDARICGAVGDHEASVLYYIFMHYCQRKANDKNQVHTYACQVRELAPLLAGTRVHGETCLHAAGAGAGNAQTARKHDIGYLTHIRVLALVTALVREHDLAHCTRGG